MNETSKTFLDWIAYSVAGATFFKLLPAIASAFSIVWIGVQLWDRFYGKNKKDK
jgi:hypothetical protein